MVVGTSGTERGAVPSPRSPRSAGSLRSIRWATLLFLMADSTDLVAGLVSPGSPIERPSGLDVAQTVLGLSACACILWRRWRWAAVLSAALVTMMLLRHSVGIELSLLVVGSASSAAALRPRRVPVVLGCALTFAVALGYVLHREDGGDWPRVTAVAAILAVAATAAGLAGGRLLREREEARAVLRHLDAENLQIRAAERRALAAELQGILTRDFRASRAGVHGATESTTPADLSLTIARAGDQARVTLASVRVALATLRAEVAPDQAPQYRSPAWIAALLSARTQHLIRLAALGVTAAALAVVWADDGAGALVATVVVVSPLTVVAALWRLPVGLTMAVGCLGLGLAVPAPLPWVALPAGLLCVVAARDGRRRWILAVVAGLLGYLAAHLVRFGGDAGPVVALLEAVGICGLLLGLTVCHFETEHHGARSEFELLHSDQARIAAQERIEVARELHDVVGHQLSLVSLHALAGERERETAVLRDLVRRIDHALEIGESEISGLVEALHSTSRDLPARTTVSPSVVATTLFSQLRGHDYHARFTVDPRIDELDPTTQSTVARFLQETSTNVLRHSPPGAECTFAASITPGAVTARARSPLPSAAPEPHLTSGYGLRGLRERVELIGGTFYAGCREGAWEVEMYLGPPSEPLPTTPLGRLRGLTSRP